MLGALPLLVVSPSLHSIGSSRALILCLLSTISPLSLSILLLLPLPLPMMQMKLTGDCGWVLCSVVLVILHFGFLGMLDLRGPLMGFFQIWILCFLSCELLIVLFEKWTLGLGNSYWLILISIFRIKLVFVKWVGMVWLFVW